MVDKYGREEIGKIAQIEKVINDPRALTLQNVFIIAQSVMGWASLTVEVFSRFLFGRRYVGFIPVLIPGLLLGGYTVALRSQGHRWWPTAVFLGLYVVLALAHKGVAWYVRFKRMEPVYTRHPGFPVIGLLLAVFGKSSYWWGLRLSSAINLAFGLNLYLYNIDRGLGGWLIFAALCEGCRTHLAYVQMCDIEDEREDGEIIAANEWRARAGAPIWETAGVARIARPPLTIGKFESSGESIATGVRERGSTNYTKSIHPQH